MTASLTKNATYITGALTIQKALSFIYFWFISNSLLPGQLGQYVFALSFAALFSMFMDIGLSPVLTREASREPEQANRYLRNVIALKLPLGAFSVLLAWLFIHLTGKPPEVRTLIYLASCITFLDSFSLSFWVVFRSRRMLGYESIATILVQIIIFVLGLTALRVSGEVQYLMAALLAASVFNFVFVSTLLATKLHMNILPKFDRQVVDKFLRLIPAFAIAGVLLKIYNSVDSVLLSYLVSDEAVGYFAIPAKVVSSLQQVIPGAFAAVIFPAFSFYHGTSVAQLAHTFRKAIEYLLVISIPLTAGILTLLPEIIATVWPTYKPIIPNFAIMTLAIPFIFLAFPTGYLLNATDRQVQNTWNRAIITALAVILNLALIPKFSYVGAGITFLITNVVLLFLDIWRTHQVIQITLKEWLSIIGRIALAAVGMVILIAGMKTILPIFIIIPAGAVVYFGLLHLFGGLAFLYPKQVAN